MHVNDQDADYFESSNSGKGPAVAAEISEADFQAILTAKQASTAADRALQAAVAAAKHHGSTWDTIGAALGVTRQAAHAKFATKL